MRKKSSSGINEPQRHIVYQRGNQRESSPHCIFLYSEDDQSEDEEIILLETRSNSNPTLPRKVEVINVQIQSDDTLQALALKYHCTISELKRINKIHKDNEIHAHKSIKVPVQPYSLLTESFKEKSEINPNNELDIIPESQIQDNTLIDNQTIVLPSTASVQINSIILNSTVEPLDQCNNESSQFFEDLETDQLITSADHTKINSSNNFVNSLKCSGADWGLSWFQLLCFSLLLGFAGPIIYILYNAESSKHHSS